MRTGIGVSIRKNTYVRLHVLAFGETPLRYVATVLLHGIVTEIFSFFTFFKLRLLPKREKRIICCVTYVGIPLVGGEDEIRQSMLMYFYIAVFLLIYEFLLLDLFFNSNCFRETS